MEGDAEANGKLKIIKADIWAIKPLINECVDDFNIKERKVIEDFCLLLALDQLLKSVIARSSSLDRSMASFSFLKTAAGVSA